MTNIITFGGLAATVPVGWFDVTDELSEGSPLTLAKKVSGPCSLRWPNIKLGDCPQLEKRILKIC